jgi:hypothetical protein
MVGIFFEFNRVGLKIMVWRKKMRIGFSLFIFLCSVLTLGFVNNARHKTINGCAGSSCHSYLPGFIRVKNMENLKIKVVPDFKGNKAAVSAALLNERGHIVDFQETTYKKEFILNAPRPGKYKILAGYQLSKLYWDSLTTEITTSTISIPTSRYSTSTFDFFPVHPNSIREGAVLRFILPGDSEVEIVLYTSSGIPAKRIFKGNLSEGMHGIYWEAKDDRRRKLIPGSYLCELRCGQKKLVQRLFVHH